MRALQLDYHAKAKKFPLGGVVLVAGALSAAFMFQEYRTLQQELSTWEARVTEIRKSAKRGVTGAPAKPRELEATALEVKAARAAIQRLLLPWDTLFSALESVHTTDVALLSIEADPDKRTVKLTAEAKSDTDMLNYVQQLQAANGLGDVALASHQAKQDDPLKPLRFVVVASWTMQP